MDASDRSELDAVRKHLTRREPPARPEDYGRQSPRLVREIARGLVTDNTVQFGRGRLDDRSAFNVGRSSEEAQALIADMTVSLPPVAGDRDVFGAETVRRAMGRMRRDRPSPELVALAARNDARLADAEAELEARATAEVVRLDASQLQAEWPGMSAETAELLAGDDEPLAAA